jgi:hypothetical protein
MFCPDFQPFKIIQDKIKWAKIIKEEASGFYG